MVFRCPFSLDLGAPAALGAIGSSSGAPSSSRGLHASKGPCLLLIYRGQLAVDLGPHLALVGPMVFKEAHFLLIYGP